MVSSYFVYIGFGPEGDFSPSRGDRWAFFASLLTGTSLASSCLLEGGSGELLVLHNLRSYVISRGDGGRQDFDAREEVDDASKGNFKRGEFCAISWSGVDSCLDVRKVASPFGAFGVDEVAEALADGPNPSFSLAIGVVMIGRGHIEINFDVGHELHPEAGGELGVSIRDDRCRETVDGEDSFDKEVSSFDCCNVLRYWDEVGEPSEAIQHN